MKEVALLGMGRSLVDLPARLPGEVWGQNRVFEMTSRKLDKLFFFDDYRIFGLEKLSALDTAIITKEAVPGLKNCTAYPLKKVVETLNLKRTYFANTTSYMLAYAIYLGYGRIRMYGIDMSYEKEYLTAQKPCVEYWVGFAESRGMEVMISKGSEVCNHRQPYGYGSQDADNRAGQPVTFISKYRRHKLFMGEELIQFENSRFTTSRKDQISFLSRDEFKGMIVKGDPANYGLPAAGKPGRPA